MIAILLEKIARRGRPLCHDESSSDVLQLTEEILPRHQLPYSLGCVTVHPSLSSLVLCHLLSVLPVESIYENCKQGVYGNKCQPLIEVDAAKVVAEVQERDCHDPVDQEAIHVALQAALHVSDASPESRDPV